MSHVDGAPPPDPACRFTNRVFTNWAGNVSARPAAIWSPRSEDELAAMLRREPRRRVRAIGSGHSFTPLGVTGGALVRLEALRGVIAIDPAARTAEVWAGTPLHALGEPLWDAGLSLENMGDIDRQTVAGAISTGTHGTGTALGSLSTQVIALHLLTAEGCALWSGDGNRGDLPLAAAALSLGALGVITRARLRLVPAYRLHERMWKVGFDQCLGELEERFSQHRHFEVFWFPQADLAAMKALDLTELDAEPTLYYDGERFEGERIGPAHRVLPSARERRFVEMEYSVPAVAGTTCLVALRRLMRERHPTVRWPIEYRRVAADDLWLSPAHQRDVVTLSIHQGRGLPYRRFFADAEAVFRAHGGRPHWGKLHSLRAAELEALYPRWRSFRAVRQRLDPAGRFLNPHLRALLEAPATRHSQPVSANS
jgi:FAD/FMN-containing dehydrogenase